RLSHELDPRLRTHWACPDPNFCSNEVGVFGMVCRYSNPGLIRKPSPLHLANVKHGWSSVSGPMTKRRWLIVTLLTLSAVINYLDHTFDGAPREFPPISRWDRRRRVSCSPYFLVLCPDANPHGMAS